MSQPEYTLEKVARLVLVPLAVVRKWVAAGRLPCRQGAADGRSYVSRADLMAFVEANEMPPLPPEGSPDPVESILARLPPGLRARMAAELGADWPPSEREGP